MMYVDPDKIKMSKLHCGVMFWPLPQGVLHQITSLRPASHKEMQIAQS